MAHAEDPPPISINGVTVRLDPHPDHGNVAWVEAGAGTYLTADQRDLFVRELTALPLG